MWNINRVCVVRCGTLTECVLSGVEECAVAAAEAALPGGGWRGSRLQHRLFPQGKGHRQDTPHKQGLHTCMHLSILRTLQYVLVKHAEHLYVLYVVHVHVCIVQYVLVKHTVHLYVLYVLHVCTVQYVLVKHTVHLYVLL